MLKIGVLGAGHLGKIHIKCIKEIPEYDLIGFFDSDEEISKTVEKEFDIRRYNSLDELVDAVDMVDIVTPTISHFECASKSLKKFQIKLKRNLGSEDTVHWMNWLMLLIWLILLHQRFPILSVHQNLLKNSVMCSLKNQLLQRLMKQGS